METKPIIDATPPLLTRTSLAAQTWAFKALATTVFSASAIWKPSFYQKYAPTYTKAYAIRPMLRCRFFIPSNHQAGSTSPLYIDIHGGGFFAGEARFDDKFCHYLCNKFGFVVVSLEYRLAPTYPFPTSLDDCTELVLAILSDPDAPIDSARVVVGGQSAGGNLALALSQDPRLRSKIGAVVSLYPTVDFSHRFTGDYRDKPAGADGKGAKRDGLRPVVPLADWAYVPYGHDRTDPRLSPIYADRSALPKHVYFITAQYDKLCEETWRMAQRLARRNDVTEDEGWEVDGIRWERVPNETHGFIEEAFGSELFGGSSCLPWKKETEDVLERIGEWLERVLSR